MCLKLFLYIVFNKKNYTIIYLHAIIKARSHYNENVIVYHVDRKLRNKLFFEANVINNE